MRGDLAALPPLIRRSTLVVTLLSLPLALALVLFGRPALAIFGPDFVPGYAALVILALGQLGNAVTGSVGQLLNMTGHERDTATAMATSAALNIVLNAALIPLWSYTGAAIATTISMLVWNAMLAAFAYQRFGFWSAFGIIHLRTKA